MTMYPYASYNISTLQGKAHKTLQICITKCLTKYNLSLPEWKVLGQLYDQKHLRVADLSIILGYDASFVTNIIDALESKGILQRKTSKTDLRVKRIVITQTAKTLIPTIESEIWKMLHILLQDISQKELVSYMKTLRVIIESGRNYLNAVTLE